jgi:hypothetical protein
MDCRALAAVLTASAAIALGGCSADSKGATRAAAVDKACQHFLQAFSGSWGVSFEASSEADKARAERDAEKQINAIGEMQAACKA